MKKVKRLRKNPHRHRQQDGDYEGKESGAVEEGKGGTDGDGRR